MAAQSTGLLLCSSSKRIYYMHVKCKVRLNETFINHYSKKLGFVKIYLGLYLKARAKYSMMTHQGMQTLPRSEGLASCDQTLNCQCHLKQFITYLLAIRLPPAENFTFCRSDLLMATKSLLSRPFDLLIFIFFLTHIPITIFIDSQSGKAPRCRPFSGAILTPLMDA